MNVLFLCTGNSARSILGEIIFNDLLSGHGHDIDLMISVCDSAANDCPAWPGKDSPNRVNWPLPDPETEEDFENIYQDLKEKISGLAVTLQRYTPRRPVRRI